MLDITLKKNKLLCATATSYVTCLKDYCSIRQYTHTLV